ncbi:MAG: stage V sporulation protein AC [Clostridia bacterium]|nr:stage V sporulation protein AC [Clostridia bacterium]MBQ1411636.1 stage V sporulation protein AC [Clostridia bacterium]MBQ1554954.1 stage V sporulation protein AC [Clostridia bacterium]
MSEKKITPAEYSRMAQQAVPPSPLGKDCLTAFVTGGAICCAGQLVTDVMKRLHFAESTAQSSASIALIAVAALLTALGLFAKIAKHAGAGTLVPITGFSNSIVSPAIEFKSEGQVFGIGANMFKIAGPVLVFGISASILYGILYWMFLVSR